MYANISTYITNVLYIIILVVVLVNVGNVNLV